MKTFQNLYIDLNGYVLDTFIEQLTKNCGKSWKRAFEREENARYFNEKAFAFEYIGGNGLPNAGLTLFEKEPSIWYVPNIVPIESGQLNVDEYNKILVDFKASLVDSAIQNTSIKVELTKDQVFLEDIVGKEAADALKRFSVAANKSSGNSHPCDKKRWFEFLVLAQKSGKNLYPNILESTLIEQGWSGEWAHDLALEFEHDQELLDFVSGV
ncbi:conserved hypothetical protein [Crenothrix polyspora]|uniref:Uncharacterized protein n=1 Tax=Crenothrix polyspora TaxID=360316 RepID=A0A1R4GZS8_9GAMM|nr:hypothetical protein [Crenothrix polyspora]SJM89456.1 conserved hypothetical protein [Crenothrix polyspora]